MKRNNFPLSPLEFELMAIIRRNPHQNGRQIAARHELWRHRPLSFGSLYTTLRRLIERKLVLKRSKLKRLKDNRKAVFRLSTRGRETLTKMRADLTRLAAFEA
ncbi:MAG: hypothetical protein V4697_01855 [Patescibacteria group bacterium]